MKRVIFIRRIYAHLKVVFICKFYYFSVIFILFISFLLLIPSFNSFFCKDTCDVLILFMAVNTILHRRTVLRHCTVIYHVNGKLTLCKRLVVNTASFVHDSLITTCTQHFFEILEMNIFQGYVLAVLHA